KDVHIKVDGCLGQSFLRSYATLTSSTADTDDIVAYYGITKSV
ncbi:MspA family porin, partial [Mycolicibacterium sp. lyk4-40-TYG-92]